MDRTELDMSTEYFIDQLQALSRMIDSKEDSTKIINFIERKVKEVKEYRKDHNFLN